MIPSASPRRLICEMEQLISVFKRREGAESRSHVGLEMLDGCLVNQDLWDRDEHGRVSLAFVQGGNQIGGSERTCGME